MGSPLASILADLFMNYIEEEIEPLIYIYKEESLFVCLFVCLLFMHLDTVCANAIKLCREYPFVQGKVVG